MRTHDRVPTATDGLVSRCQGWQGAADGHGWPSVAVPRMARSGRRPGRPSIASARMAQERWNPTFSAIINIAQGVIAKSGNPLIIFYRMLLTGVADWPLE